MTEARQRLNLANSALQPRINNFLSANYDQEYLAAHKNKLIPNTRLDPHFVRSSLLRLYHEYRLAMFNECNRLSKPDILRYVARYKGNDLPGFVSITTFKNIVNGHYLDGWKCVTNEHVLKMHEHLSKALSDFILYAADASSRDVFIRVFERFSRSQADSIKSTIMDIFEDESSPFTLSSQYLDAVKKDRSKTNRAPSVTRGQSVIDLNKPNGDYAPPSSYISPPTAQNAPDTPQPSPNDRMSPTSSPDGDLSYSPLQQQQDNYWDDEHTSVEMIPCLHAYLTAARERIVDKVLMETIERHMINRIGRYFDMIIKATDVELACMLESPMLKRRRQDFETKIADFEGILNDL
ncbi:hypothetical protein BGW39_001707 [Mortierella sp. 14UC]|nr:hypothetical protein BGW39_001707 [Mortierella sp. 14UC]